MRWTGAPALPWRSMVGEWWANVWRWALMAAGTVIGVYLVLDRGLSNGVTVAAAIGVLVIGIVLTGRVALAIPLLAMPALLVETRVGFGGGDLTVSDTALAAAFAAAILLGHRPYSPPLRALLWLNLVYQFASLITVIVNPYAQNTVEWFHAWLLVSGALVVGWAVARAGYARFAFIALMISGSVLAVGTVLTGIVQYAHGDFSAVYPAIPWPMHKNFVGTTLAFVVLIAFIRPRWADLPVGWTRAAFWLMLVAIGMSQSRQAWIGLAVALIVIVLRRGGHWGVAVLIAIPAIWVAILMVIDQVNSQNQFNSVFQRLNWFREVVRYWKTDPLFGHGLRFWYVDSALPYQPPQAELEIAASTGAIGLLGFAIMCIGTLIVLWRVNPAYGTLAFAAVLSRLVQGQFDLFWISVSVSVPFVIAGICLGSLARDTSPPGARGGRGAMRDQGALPLPRSADAIR